MQAVAGATLSPATSGAAPTTSASPAGRRASRRVVAAVVLGLVVAGAVFTGTGDYPTPADERPGSGAERVVTP